MRLYVHNKYQYRITRSGIAYCDVKVEMEIIGDLQDWVTEQENSTDKTSGLSDRIGQQFWQNFMTEWHNRTTVLTKLYDWVTKQDNSSDKTLWLSDTTGQQFWQNFMTEWHNRTTVLTKLYDSVTKQDNSSDKTSGLSDRTG